MTYTETSCRNWLQQIETSAHGFTLPTNTTILDVREPDEYHNGHIQGAINMPLSTWNQNTVNALVEGQNVVIHCKSGGRTTQFASCFQNIVSAKQVTVLNDGIMGFVQAGGSLVT
jgi:rhodanese-related sulfurtransferase